MHANTSFNNFILVSLTHSVIDIVEMFINEHPEKLTCKDLHGNTPLMTAIINGCERIVVMLLTMGDCRIDSCDTTQNTILHLMARHPFDDVMQLVCKRIFEEYPLFVNMKNVNGETPLHTAVEAGNVQLVKMLLAEGANAKETTKDNKSVADYAQYAQRNTKDILGLITTVIDTEEQTVSQKEKEIDSQGPAPIPTKTMAEVIEDEKQKDGDDSKMLVQKDDAKSKKFLGIFKTKDSERMKNVEFFRSMLMSVRINENMLRSIDSCNRKKKFRILSLDGGGMKCIMQAIILRRLVDKFPTLLEETNLFCGVSASSFICVDFLLGIRPSALVDLLVEMYSHMFEKKSRGYTESLYSNKYLIDITQMTYGEKKLSDLSRHILINAFQFDSGESDPDRKCKACMFNNFIPGCDCKIADACIRSAAAVGYYPPYQGYADGGIFENNPSVCAYPYVFGEKGLGIDIKNTVCLSLSSGRPPCMYMDKAKYQDVGMLQLMPICMDGFFWSRVCWRK